MISAVHPTSSLARTLPIINRFLALLEAAGIARFTVEGAKSLLERVSRREAIIEGVAQEDGGRSYVRLISEEGNEVGVLLVDPYAQEHFLIAASCDTDALDIALADLEAETGHDAYIALEDLIQ